MNFKLKVVSAAVVCAFGLAQQAYALTIAGNSTTTLATEQLNAVTNVTLNNVGFSSTSQGVVLGNGYSISIKLSSGTWATAGTLSQINQAVSPPAAYGSETYTAAGVGTDTLTFTLNGVAAVSTTPGNTFFLLNGAVINGAGLASALITSGVNDNGCAFGTGQVTITGKYFNSNGAEVDLPVGTGNIGTVIVADQGITGLATASVGPVLDVLTNLRPGAAPAASKFVRTNGAGTAVNVLSAPIGTIKFSDKAGLQGQAAAPSTDYNLAAATDGGATMVITASAGWGTGATLTVIDDTANTACVADPTATPAITAGTPIAATTTTVGNTKTLSFATGTLNSLANRGKTFTVCYNVTGTTGNVPASKFTGYAIETRTGTDIADYASGANCPATLAAASLNGGIISIRNYSPAAANAFGWNQYVRIINAGSVATPITGYFQYADGTVSDTKTIVATIPAGGSTTISNTAIEAAMGITPALAASNPRLVIIGSTERLRVQNYIVQPGGNWVESSGGQDDGAGPAGTNN